MHANSHVGPAICESFILGTKGQDCNFTILGHYLLS